MANPDAKLSLQKKHWVVVKDGAKVTCGDKAYTLGENQSTYIHKGEMHRLENTEKIALEIIEIQTKIIWARMILFALRATTNETNSFIIFF